ncbi:MAG: M3 family metallopeptidase [Bacteroidaceae bacterium]|nr:M3 family metallopeptidase [Bacteroidaceae bacterium]
MTSCMDKKNENPFFSEYTTPHQTAPFDKIRIEHYEPAVLEGIKQHQAEVDAIVNNPEAPTFENTVVALEYAGDMLNRVLSVFFNLNSAETSDEMQALAQKLSPILTEHSNNVSLNEALFARIKTVYETTDKSALTTEQQRLLQSTYDGFARSGANLNDEDKAKYRELTTELSQATLAFGQNTLKATNSFALNVTDSARLKGMPESLLEAAAQTAKEKGQEGWTFTLHAPSYSPLMMYCEDRDLRRQMYMAYNTQCVQDNENNNGELVKKIVNLRLAIAQLLGYESHADYVLENRMAENADNVNQLLDQLLEAYLPAAKEDVKAVQEIAARTEGKNFELMPWDWSFYSEKLRSEKYSLNDEMVRPYFKLENVIKGVFGLATRLYGITFEENKEIPVFHPDVKAYDVLDKDGSYLAVIYTDFFPRAGKRSGAWMTSYQEQFVKDGVDNRPHVSITMNFTKPTASKPALLTQDEVETFLHEFGHALHGIFAATTYPSMGGTNVYRDFVELPSQLMENFLPKKEFLSTFAYHYETGELIPDELIERIVRAQNYNAAYACIRQLSLGILDMAWYSRTTPFEGDVLAYEQKAWESTQLLPTVEGTNMTTHFGHIMSGGYSAGYYSYKWSEMLDADAFSLFEEKGLYSEEVATSFRKNILEKGGSEHPKELYRRFRGQDATIDALMKRDGIK